MKYETEWNSISFGGMLYGCVVPFRIFFLITTACFLYGSKAQMSTLITAQYFAITKKRSFIRQNMHWFAFRASLHDSEGLKIVNSLWCKLFRMKKKIHKSSIPDPLRYKVTDRASFREVVSHFRRSVVQFVISIQYFLLTCFLLGPFVVSHTNIFEFYTRSSEGKPTCLGSTTTIEVIKFVTRHLLSLKSEFHWAAVQCTRLERHVTYIHSSFRNVVIGPFLTVCSD